MKKLPILIPGLMVATVTPAIAVTACGNKAEPTFTVDSVQYGTSKDGLSVLKWKPMSRKIEFVENKWKFSCGGGITATIDVEGTLHEGFVQLALTFSKQPQATYNNGVLIFEYISLSKEKVEVKIENITVQPRNN